MRWPEYGVKLVVAPWTRKGSAFTEQAYFTLAREIPGSAAAQIIEINDHRLWRIIEQYVAKVVAGFDLSKVQVMRLDETASKRGRNYVTVFTNMQRQDKPVPFVTPGHGKATLQAFRKFFITHKGQPEQILKVVCNISGPSSAPCRSSYATPELPWTDFISYRPSLVRSMIRGRRVSVA